jgi:isopentenyl phosphate kinase
LITKVLLIKLGGSVVTIKDQALTPNTRTIDGLSHVLAKIKDPLVIIHGGGSFGHYWSVRYNMHTEPDLYDSHGISIVHESMMTLNQIIVKSLLEAGLRPYGIPPTSLFADGRVNVTKIKELLGFVRRGLVPVIFGDIVPMTEGRFSIKSGDSLMTIVATQIGASRAIFTVNVDGVYEDMTSKKLVKVLNFPNSEIHINDTSVDVTGGMGRKILEAFEIAKLGIDVHIVNGLNIDRVFDVLRGREVEGTTIPAATLKEGLENNG